MLDIFSAWLSKNTEKINFIIMYATNALKLLYKIQNCHNCGHGTSFENVFTRFC